MKICFIAPSYNRKECGVADYTGILADRLRNEGHETSIIASDGHVEDSRRIKGIRIYPLGKRWGFRDYIKISRLMKEIKPDILHIQYQSFNCNNNPMINALPWLLKYRFKKNKMKIIVTLHDLSAPFFMGINARIFRKIGQAIWLTLIMLYCDSFAMSNEYEWMIVERSMPGFLHEKIKRKFYLIPIPSSVPVLKMSENDINLKRREMGFKADEKAVIFFGFVRSGKGIDILLRSMGGIIQRGYKVKLVVLGGVYEKEYHKVMLRLSKQMGISKNVLWTGYRSQKETSEMLHTGEICVMPYEDGVATYRSSFSTVAEHGLPTITTKGKIIPKGLKDGFNVLLFEAKDNATLTRLIVSLLDDEKMRENLAKNIKRYSHTLSWENTIRRIEKMYGMCAKEK
ncbi:hypothetical protein COV19_05505 [Candidatus Woesearchaeota archaeon CG10_big_fil_rev_8_21_14_0_10_44_13]|nr:MAG: hypothetical protein COV19_05505 [Candidatus Woesearchaeota archaeon CG10_big_fil_rev_8_21_14_0_10_44_13]